MIMDVLDRSIFADVYHETDPRAFDKYSLKDTDELLHLYEQSNAQFFVLKALQDSHRITKIRAQFTDSYVIWPYREYKDMVNSHMVSWPSFREKIDEIVRGECSEDWRFQGLSEVVLSDIRRVYRKNLNIASCIALFWYIRNSLLFTQKLDNDPSVIVVEYERIVTEPDNVFGEIFKRVGIPYQESVHSIVHSKSISKRAPPPIDKQVEALCEDMHANLQQLRSRIPKLTSSLAMSHN